MADDTESPQQPLTPLEQDIRRSRRVIRSLKAKEDEKRTASDRLADRMSELVGSMRFLGANVAFFAAWIALNTGIVPGVVPFDPFPFGMLTMVVSLEAIILAIFVLIAQNRAEKVAELREEVDLQIDTIAEQELTKLLHMVALLLEKHGIDMERDEELQEMLAPTNIDKVEEILEQQIINPPRADKGAKQP